MEKLTAFLNSINVQQARKEDRDNAPACYYVEPDYILICFDYSAGDAMKLCYQRRRTEDFLKRHDLPTVFEIVPYCNFYTVYTQEANA